jgi:hypothetical protein
MGTARQRWPLAVKAAQVVVLDVLSSPLACVFSAMCTRSQECVNADVEQQRRDAPARYARVSSTAH